MQSYFGATPGLVTTEEDVRRLILRERTGRRLNTPIVIRWGKGLVVLGLLAGIIYATLNAPALFIRTRYLAEQNLLPARTVVPTAPPSNVPGATAAAQTVPKLDDNHIFIDRVQIKAPIIWDVPDTNSTVLKNLENGVVHLRGNAKPGEYGNVFLVGHSSNVLWAKGSYKQVFALLPELAIGDTITITYHGYPYQYRVTTTKTIDPTETAVLDNAGLPKLTLMTCVPLGTNLKRFIVVAEPTNPNLHATSISSASSTGTRALPTSR